MGRSQLNERCGKKSRSETEIACYDVRRLHDQNEELHFPTFI